MPSSWEAATAVRKLDAATYECTLQDDWCIGSGTFQLVVVVLIHTDQGQCLTAAM